MVIISDSSKKHQLYFIYIVGCPGDILDGKIQTLNMALKESIPYIQRETDKNPNAEVLICAIKISDGAKWHIANPTSIKDFRWTDLSTIGSAEMGKAFSMVADQLKILPMNERALPPVLLLISDGQSTDDFDTRLWAIMDQPWGKTAVRIAIEVGKDADNGILQRFIGNPEIKCQKANNPEALIKYIKRASMVILKSASAPQSQTKSPISPILNVPITMPVEDNKGPSSAGNIW